MKSQAPSGWNAENSMNTKQKSNEEIVEEYFKRIINASEEIEKNGNADHYEVVVKREILKTLNQKDLAHKEEVEEAVKEERTKLRRFVCMRYPKTDEAQELIAEIVQALTKDNKENILSEET